MQELTDKALYLALEYAKSQDEQAGRTILESFQRDQPALAHTIFGVFPAMIAEREQALAHVFMDLCFDVICVFQHAFGNLPPQHTMGFDWLAKSAAQLEPELHAMMSGNDMNPKWRDKLSQRFSDRMIASQAQTGLVDFLHAAIDQCVSQQRLNDDGVAMSKSMIFVVVQLFASMYAHAQPQPC